MSLQFSFSSSNFGDHYICFTEEDINSLRTESKAVLDSTWEVYMVPGSLRILKGDPNGIVFSFYPGSLCVEGSFWGNNVELEDAQLDAISDFFTKVWYRIRQGFNPREGFCLHGIPFPIAEEIQDHLLGSFKTELGLEFILRRMSPETSEVLWTNKDIEVPVDSGYVCCYVSRFDYIHENRRGLSFSFQRVFYDFSDNLLRSKQEFIRIKFGRDQVLVYEGCSLKLAQSIVDFLI
jgi:hypothetical protein